mmetsp:Transcript_12880/g.19511  ORF Transcript_12880/g.19511 Transcript_12880/m.19511 type:complete len:148 (-) Transcript_12880:118-561(-)
MVSAPRTGTSRARCHHQLRVRSQSERQKKKRGRTNQSHKSHLNTKKIPKDRKSLRTRQFRDSSDSSSSSSNFGRDNSDSICCNFLRVGLTLGRACHLYTQSWTGKSKLRQQPLLLLHVAVLLLALFCVQVFAAALAPLVCVCVRTVY